MNKNYNEIEGNFVHKNAFINWEFLLIGKGNVFGPFCTIGDEAQQKYYKSFGKINIGDNNIFYSSSSVSRPTSLKGETIIGSNNHIMSHSIIHHDCIIENNTTICSNVSIAGHSIIMEGSYLGQNSSIHQYQVFGSYSILGMNSCVIKRSKISPGRKYVGVPCRDIGENFIGLKRNNINSKQLKLEVVRYNELKKSNERIYE